MKTAKFITALLVALSSFGLLSFTPVETTDPSIVVKKGKININKKEITTDWSVTNFKTALGEPDRAGGTSAKVHVYDDKCISLYEGFENGGPSGTVKEIKIYYKLIEEGEFVPLGYGYKGTIKIDKLVVTKDLTPAMVRLELSKWTESSGYAAHVFRFASEGLYVIFAFSDDEKTLQKISIGPDKI